MTLHKLLGKTNRGIGAEIYVSSKTGEWTVIIVIYRATILSRLHLKVSKNRWKEKLKLDLDLVQRIIGDCSNNWPPDDCPYLRFMLNAWLCARYKCLYYYYIIIITRRCRRLALIVSVLWGINAKTQLRYSCSIVRVLSWAKLPAINTMVISNKWVFLSLVA